MGAQQLAQRRAQRLAQRLRARGVGAQVCSICDAALYFRADYFNPRAPSGRGTPPTKLAASWADYALKVDAAFPPLLRAWRRANAGRFGLALLGWAVAANLNRLAFRASDSGEELAALEQQLKDEQVRKARDGLALAFCV